MALFRAPVALSIGVVLRAASSSAPAVRAETPRQIEPPVVVRVGLELVQVDAVVTDSQGRSVTDLQAGDFEIREDGRPREITHCAYVGVGAHPGPASPPLAAPGSPSHPEQGGRTMAFVVDDLSLSFESVVRVRALLTAFVAEQMQGGDRVAIVRAASGMGALQQFTTDKRLLRAAIQSVQFSLRRRQVSAFDLSPPQAGRGSGGPAGAAQAAAAERLTQLSAEAEKSRTVYSTAGSLGALRFVLRGLRDLPGRKSVVLLSENLPLQDEDDERSAWLTDIVQGVVDAANRASVVVYSLDPTGLQPGPAGPPGFAGTLDRRRAGLSILSRDTGGLLLADSNDLRHLVDRVLDDQKGYYLIGYAPDDSTFGGDSGRPRYHKITIRTRRAGLRVRSRAGFYAVPDAKTATIATNPAAQMLDALASPFTSPDVHVRLTPLFGRDDEHGPYLRLLVHVDARDLTLVPQEDGSRTSAIGILAMTFDAAGRIGGQVTRSETLRIAPAALPRLLREGLVYVLDLPVEKAGPYQLRGVVRDDGSGRMGSASRFVELPDVSKGQLALSGIVLASTAPGGVTDASPAVRRFPPGSSLSYSLFVYNPRVDPATHRTTLEVDVSLLRDGSVIQSLPPVRFEGSGTGGSRSQAVGGTFRLAPDMKPGTYELTVVARDGLGKHARASQWTDFEVAEPQVTSLIDGEPEP